MTSIEARLGHLHTAAKRKGLSLAEYLAVCIANEFVMDWPTVVSSLAKVLHDCSYAEADADGLVAVIGCMRKRWLAVLPSGTLTLTQEGQKILAEISDAVPAA